MLAGLGVLMDIQTPRTTSVQYTILELHHHVASDACTKSNVLTPNILVYSYSTLLPYMDASMYSQLSALCLSTLSQGRAAQSQPPMQP